MSASPDLQMKCKVGVLNRLLFAVLCISLLTSLATSCILWLTEGRLKNKTVITSTMRYDMFIVDGKPMPVEWIDRSTNKELLWQLLLLAWFYPGKILIQVKFQNHARQLLWYIYLLCFGVFWVSTRLTKWDWWMCETVYSKVIGEPMLYFAVPTAFFLYDWAKERRRSIVYLLLRMPIELLLIIPWVYLWAFMELCLGWVWI